MKIFRKDFKVEMCRVGVRLARESVEETQNRKVSVFQQRPCRDIVIQRCHRRWISH